MKVILRITGLAIFGVATANVAPAVWSPEFIWMMVAAVGISLAGGGR